MGGEGNWMRGRCLDRGCGGGAGVLTIALVGLVPVLGMVVESTRRRGHPWYWFFIGACVYVVRAVAFQSFVQ